jgi:hypothetical protein
MLACDGRQQQQAGSGSMPPAISGQAARSNSETRSNDSCVQVREKLRLLQKN